MQGLHLQLAQQSYALAMLYDGQGGSRDLEGARRRLWDLVRRPDMLPHDSAAPSHLKMRADTLAAGLAATRSDAARALELGLGVLEQLHREQTAPANSNVDVASLHAVVGWAQRQAGSVGESLEEKAPPTPPARPGIMTMGPDGMECRFVLSGFV